MTIFVDVLSTQMQKIKLRSSILIIKCDAQKQMIESYFGHRFHDHNYFEVGIFFHIIIFLEFIIYFRASLQYLVETHQLMQFYCALNIIQTVTFSISPTCTPLVLSSKICRLFLKIFVSIIVWLYRSLCFQNVYDFFLHKIQRQCIVLITFIELQVSIRGCPLYYAWTHLA